MKRSENGQQVPTTPNKTVALIKPGCVYRPLVPYSHWFFQPLFLDGKLAGLTYSREEDEDRLSEY
jgi:hypothetical protein